MERARQLFRWEVVLGLAALMALVFVLWTEVSPSRVSEERARPTADEPPGPLGEASGGLPPAAGSRRFVDVPSDAELVISFRDQQSRELLEGVLVDQDGEAVGRRADKGRIVVDVTQQRDRGIGQSSFLEARAAGYQSERVPTSVLLCANAPTIFMKKHALLHFDFSGIQGVPGASVQLVYWDRQYGLSRLSMARGPGVSNSPVDSHGNCTFSAVWADRPFDVFLKMKPHHSVPIAYGCTLEPGSEQRFEVEVCTDLTLQCETLGTGAASSGIALVGVPDVMREPQGATLGIGKYRFEYELGELGRLNEQGTLSLEALPSGRWYFAQRPTNRPPAEVISARLVPVQVRGNDKTVSIRPDPPRAHGLTILAPDGGPVVGALVLVSSPGLLRPQFERSDRYGAVLIDLSAAAWSMYIYPPAESAVLEALRLTSREWPLAASVVMPLRQPGAVPSNLAWREPLGDPSFFCYSPSQRQVLEWGVPGNGAGTGYVAVPFGTVVWAVSNSGSIFSQEVSPQAQGQTVAAKAHASTVHELRALRLASLRDVSLLFDGHILWTDVLVGGESLRLLLPEGEFSVRERTQEGEREVAQFVTSTTTGGRTEF